MAPPPKPLVLGGQHTAPVPTAVSPTPPDYMPPQVAAAPGQLVVGHGTALPGATLPMPTVNTSLTPVQQGSPLTLDAINKVGVQSQRGVAEISSKLASSVKTSQMDELGDLLGKTLVAAKGYDPSNTKGKFFGIIKRKVEEIRIGYESAESTTNRLVAQMDARIATHRQRDTDIKQMIVINRQCYADLGEEIRQLEAKLDWMEANVPVVDPTDAMSAQRVQEWQTICAMGRKHCDDLTRSRAVSQQMDVQMQMLGQQGLMLVQKFESFKTTTMPILRQAFVMYIMALEQEKSAAMSESISDLTDNSLKANAAKLGQTTTAVHSSLARSNISLDAIQAGHTAMLQSLDDIERIRAEMKARIASEAPQIEAASRELSARLARPAA